MIKYFENSELNNSGDYSVQYITQSSGFTKSAGYSNLGGDVQAYIKGLKETPNKAYLLISALSDLNWGPNNNADGWPTEALANSGVEYGHKTFEKFGHWYHLHNNKDPKKSFGKVTFSAWNSQMGRVELVVEVDLMKDAKTKAAIANGDIIETSMGAKVNYDICNICHPNWKEFYNIPEEDMKKLSKTKSLDVVKKIGDKHNVDLSYVDELHPEGGVVGIHSTQARYCKHMRNSRNQIIENGQKVYVINLRPRFFDISFVRVNADKSSFVLAKVAEEIVIDKMNDEDVDVLMNEAKKAGEKTSEIEKEIKGDVLSDDVDEIKEYYQDIILPKLYENEEELPKEKLNELGKRPIEQVLSSFMSMGMFPKPKEIQRIMLVSQGKGDLADKFDKDGIHITDDDINQSHCGDGLKSIVENLSLNGGNVKEDILKMLMPHIGGKSYYRPNVVKRIIIIKEAEGEINSYIPTVPRRKSHLPGILAAIAAFAGLAKLTGSKSMMGILRELGKNKVAIIGAAAGAQAVAEIARQNRAYKNAVEGEAQMKSAALGGSLATFVGIPAASYIYAEHAMDKARKGRPLSGTETLVAKHPMAAGVGAALLVNKSSRNKLLKALGKILKVGQTIKEAGLGFDGLNIEDYPIEEQDGIIIGLWDANDKSIDKNK
jgi:hypothetical protein